jgi:PTS system D-glucosamine-specific IIC component
MHAIGIRTPEGLDVLLHIGIDTSQLKGKGFKAVVKEGDQVNPGQLLITFDIQQIRRDSKSLATPMVITNADRVRSWSFAPFKGVKRGQASVMSVVLKERSGGGDTA